MYDDQVRLKNESDIEKERETRKESDMKKRCESSKTREVDTKCRETESGKEEVLASEEKKERKQVNFYARESDVKRALFLNQPMIVLLYKGACVSTNEFTLLCLVLLFLFCRTLVMYSPRRYLMVDHQ
ncbi:hypothetical protein Pfo_031276 [Paulownia fortunei]|nr:hypothetical protein Pfo_031276 [Paulownia fortunei]